MTGRRFALIAGAALLCVLALTVIRPGQSEAGPAPVAFSGSITIEAPNEIDAGTSAEIDISSTAPDGSPVELYVVGAVDTQRLVGRLRGGRADLRVPAAATEHAGELLLVAKVGDAQASTRMRTVATAAVDPVVPLVGPRTVIADNEDMTMVVVVAADEFGNPLAAGTEASISLVRPDGREQLITTPVEGGVASALLRSDTVAGRVAVSSTVDGAEGPSHSFDQVAGRPADFTLRPLTVSGALRDLVADGFSLHSIETSVLRDVFGNELPDGVAVEFVVDGPYGRSLSSATVQGGRSRTRIEAPREAGDVTVTARVSGHESTPLVVSFGAAVTTFDVERVDRSVVVGPVLATQGGYVADGTTVNVVEISSGETVATGSLLAGRATIRLTLGVPTSGLAVSVLGAETAIDES